MKQHNEQHFCCDKSRVQHDSALDRMHRQHPPSGPDRFSNWEIQPPDWYSWLGQQVLFQHRCSSILRLQMPSEPNTSPHTYMEYQVRKRGSTPANLTPPPPLLHSPISSFHEEDVCTDQSLIFHLKLEELFRHLFLPFTYRYFLSTLHQKY